MGKFEYSLNKRAEKYLAAGVNLEMVQAINSFAESRREAGLAERTCQMYAWEAGQLALTCPALAPVEYDRAEIDRYLGRRYVRLARSSYKASVIGVRAFFQWARGAQSPAAHLKVPNRNTIKPVRKTRSLNRTQYDELLASFDTSKLSGSRDAAIMALMLDTAFRASELLAVHVMNLDLENRRASVRCKGGKTGLGKFSEDTRALLLRWLDFRRYVARPDELALFVSLNTGNALTLTGLTRIFRVAAERVGLPALSPHDLRRTFAHEVLRAGASERVAMQGGRWSSRQVFHDHYTRDINVDDIDAYLPTRPRGSK